VRVAILWKQMAGYTAACFRALQDQGAEVLLAHRAATSDAPFDDSALALDAETVRWTRRPDERSLQARLRRFDPDVLLVCSWDVGGYRRIARAMAGRTLRVLFMDNPWLGTPKQWAGRAVSPLLVRPTCDAVFLPGDRQADFAGRLGLPEDRILWGAYAGDHDRFAAVADARSGTVNQVFVFVGRLVAEKGVDTLADGYRAYRSAAVDPWPLTVCGTGAMGTMLAGIPGVEMRGFVQPSDMPEIYAGTGCLVLPSRFEPWGVAIHEAAAAGLAVVASRACGASTRLVLDGYNGAVIPPSDPGALARALALVAGAPDLDLLGSRSRELARQFTPDRWASYFLRRTGELRRLVGL
jgi:glycosyltransferase involved in cell wall biosynthesis